MAKQEDDLSIGVFAQRPRLSARALRIYDELGLLLPVFVDSQTGYRYYRIEQVEKARLIGLMRRLEMPLPTFIGEAMSSLFDRVSAKGQRSRGGSVRHLSR